MKNSPINEIGTSGPRFEMFSLLDAMQETGYTNMFNAPRILRDKFGISRKASYEIFSQWTANFSKEV